MNSQVEFRVAYDGPALAGHLMDVQQLGPALLAIGDLCREANRVLNGEGRLDVTVHVKATGEGCFDITFQLIQFYNQLKGLVADDDVATAKQIAEWLGLIGMAVGAPLSLLRFLKWKRGRRITTQEVRRDDSGNVSYNITVEGDGNVVTITEQVHKLYQAPLVRAAQRRMVAPLENDGINEFQVRHETGVLTSIAKDDVKAGYLDLLSGETEESVDEELVEPQTFETVLLLRAPVFVEGNKWQFFNGDQQLTATLSDPAFVRRVFERGERFGYGDRFRVRLRLTQILRPNGKIHNDYEIVEVIETRRGPQQVAFR